MEKKAWLVRPNTHTANRMGDFLENNIIAIGWSGIGTLEGKSKEEIKKILQDKPYEYTSLILGNVTSSIDIFVNGMEIGDLVLMPDNDDIYIGEVESNYIYEKTKDIDEASYPHQRKIIFLRKILRSELPTNLRTALKIHRVTADLSRYYETIKLLSEGNIIEFKDDKNEFIDVEYPIRPGVMIKLSIPANMHQSEATRFSEFVKTLYFVSCHGHSHSHPHK